MTVLLMVIDGLRPDAITRCSVPNMEKLIASGAYTLRASSVMPSVTLPCHTSIFHSVTPQRHGIMSNMWQPMARPLPGIIEQAKIKGRTCYAFYNWEPLRDVSRPENLDFGYFRNNSETRDGDHVIASVAADILATERPDFAFVYLGTVDWAGHQQSWMSEFYLGQVEHVDSAAGMVLDSLREDDTVLLLADHGGHDRMHGTELPEDMTIPWIIAGPAIRRGYEVETAVSLLDVAPTLARLLDVPAAGAWEGRYVEEAFSDGLR